MSHGSAREASANYQRANRVVTCEPNVENEGMMRKGCEFALWLDQGMSHKATVVFPMTVFLLFCLLA